MAPLLLLARRDRYKDGCSAMIDKQESGTRSRAQERCFDIGCRTDCLLVYLFDHISLPNTRIRCRTRRINLRDNYTLRCFTYSQLSGNVGRQWFDTKSQLAGLAVARAL